MYTPKNKFSGLITGSRATKSTSSFKRKKSLNCEMEGEDINVQTVLFLNDKQEEEVRIIISVFDTVNKKWITKETKNFTK